MIKKVFLIILTFFMCLSFTNAETIKKINVTTNNLNVRIGPGTNYDSVRTLAIDSKYELVSLELFKNEKGCTAGWYKIYYSGTNTGYVCSSYTQIVDEEKQDYAVFSECEQDLKNKGFPQSYLNPLCALKDKYPNWNFEADNTGLSFPTVIEKESVVGKSLIQSSNQGYLSTDSSVYDYLTDTFKVKEGTNWYAASNDVVAYYLDPRNFFDERYIFMFEKLSFDETYQTAAAIEKVLSGRDLASLSGTILTAANNNNINAIYLASKIRQETGANYSNYSLSGKSITYNGTTYPHVYNPYNIGANTGANDGLIWAVSGTSYLRPWTTVDIAIQGGASVIASTYINKGQNSIYFQKFNTSSYSSYSPYAHQYMTNIRGASSEASIAYDGYKGMDLLSSTNFTFVIPVYSNMNDTNYSLPDPGNPNNHLKSLTINNASVQGFSHDNYSYKYYVASGTQSVDVSATAISSKATVSGIGKVPLTDKTTDIIVTVTSGNNVKQNYTITVEKTDGMDISLADLISSINIPRSDNYFVLNAGYSFDIFIGEVKGISSLANITKNGNASKVATGEVVTITNGSESNEYTLVVKGDPTGDGNINIQDLLRVQKSILGLVDLNGSFSKAADTNQDGTVDILDLLRIQKHILGYLTIS